MVMAGDDSVAEAVVSRWSLSQDRVNFILRIPELRICCRKASGPVKPTAEELAVDERAVLNGDRADDLSSGRPGRRTRLRTSPSVRAEVRAVERTPGSTNITAGPSIRQLRSNLCGRGCCDRDQQDIEVLDVVARRSGRPPGWKLGASTMNRSNSETW
jgi:hypothetical protein